MFCSLLVLSLTELALFSNRLLTAPLFPTLYLAMSHCPYSSYSHPQESSPLYQDGLHRNQCPLERGIACETMSDFPIYQRPARVTDWPQCQLLCALSPPRWFWSLQPSSWISLYSITARLAFCLGYSNLISLCISSTIIALFLTTILLNSSSLYVSLSRLNFNLSLC